MKFDIFCLVAAKVKHLPPLFVRSNIKVRIRQQVAMMTLSPQQVPPAIANFHNTQIMRYE